MWLLAALLGNFSGGEERRPEMGVNGRGGLESEQINNRGELDCVSSASKLLLKLLGGRGGRMSIGCWAEGLLR